MSNPVLSGLCQDLLEALALACKLVEEHARDDRVEAVSVNHSQRWTSPSLHRLAGLTHSETDQGIKRADSDEVATLAGGGDIE